MLVSHLPKSLALQQTLVRTLNAASAATSSAISPWNQRLNPLQHVLHTRARARGFHSTTKLRVLMPVNLADIGEGIVECEIIQWFVEPGARVEQFSPLCEVQSDKASTEISSKYDGVVRKLYYEPGDMARVGKPFVDIDTDNAVIASGATAGPIPPPPVAAAASITAKPRTIPATPPATTPMDAAAAAPEGNGAGKKRHANLAVPAVRHLCKTHGVDIAQISGTGREGRVLKEDILRFVASTSASAPASSAAVAHPASSQATLHQQVETTQVLTPLQQHMFRTMTRSLTIPHFLYADEVDFSDLTTLRARLNKVLAAQQSPIGSTVNTVVDKLSYLPFIIKAVSLALYRYPILNARVDATSNDKGKPTLVHRSLHNIGIAMDTPTGLVVPVVKDVGSRNVLSIAAELSRLQKSAMSGSLGPGDLNGGTITVSNIGNIGGTYVSPVIVEKEVAILGIGRMRTVPAFGDDGEIVRKQVCNFSWSADHRVVDGATMARAAEVVRKVVEEPDVMVLHLR